MAADNDNKPASVPQAEEKVLKFWRDQDIFAKSLAQREGGESYVFYDGPPFATGTPHYGHILVSAIKDAVPRYQTMRGKYVPRRWGWDTHGLPIENIVEKQLGISGKKQIEELGVSIFNDKARSQVLEYVGEWKKTVERMARWVDFDGSYKTMDNDYIESVWHALGTLHDKGLVYEGTRVLPYCPRCETPIANSEIAMDNSYKDITDISVYVKFELDGHPGTYFVAWTTTPWTLPGNTGLAVNADAFYVKVKATEKNGARGEYIFAKERLEKMAEFFESYEVLGEKQGKEFAGGTYKPLFDYYADKDMPNKENIWKTHLADYVTLEDGTGIVHLAPAFGEIDMELAKQEHIPAIWHVGPDGRFKSEVTDFAGQSVKPKGDHQHADIEIIKYLAGRGSLLAKEKIVHSYPHCFRCETPLFYYAIPAWFINIQQIKADLLAKNEEIHWVPEHLKEGRFKKSMEGAPDWNISRNRYWASPLPIWKCDTCHRVHFVKSVAELREQILNRNEFILIRHGESEKNVADKVSAATDGVPLTSAGRAAVEQLAEELKSRGITKIYASPVERTRQTAELISQALNLPIEFDDRLREINFGQLEGKDLAEFRGAFSSFAERFTKRLPGAENLADVKARVREFAESVQAHNQSEVIAIVSHGDPLWLLAAQSLGKATAQEIQSVPYPQRASATEMHYPEMDLHRPWIDELRLPCECGATMNRIPEVIDCWFESGSMPFAAGHVPFENEEWFKQNFPGDFITEYIAQTRTWFYYTHVLGVALFDSPAFRHVLTTGTVLAEDGQKMSKSKNNFPDPWLMFDKYGADAMRYYMLASPLLHAEDLNFSERGLDEVFKKVILRLKNAVAFYELYPDSQEILPQPNSENVLDKWILARLSQLTVEVTAAMEEYLIEVALRPIDAFIDDLSVWYIRRSRDRFKSEDMTERLAASVTLRYVLLELSKVMAPFTPFVAEEIYQKVAASQGKESVHLEDWPQGQTTNMPLLEEMAAVRRVVTLGLEQRNKEGIKVRQPLASISITGAKSFSADLEQILLDELNIKSVSGYTMGDDVSVAIDTVITPELKREGYGRDLARQVQGMRKMQDFQIEDKATIFWQTDDADLTALLETFEKSSPLATTSFAKAQGQLEHATAFELDDKTVHLELARA